MATLKYSTNSDIHLLSYAKSLDYRCITIDLFVLSNQQFPHPTTCLAQFVKDP